MTKKEKNPFENAPRLLLPLWSRMDEFEEFLVMDKQVFHITDYIDNPGEHGTDMMYFYEINWNDIIVQCIFYQSYAREEDEEEKTETTYLVTDKIFAKWINACSSEEAEKYKEWKLKKEEKDFKDYLTHLSKPHPIEEDNWSRTPEAIAKIKSFLFYQTLWKKESQDLIQNEIDKLWDKIGKEDLDELNEIKETWCIKRPKHYEQLYCFRWMREMAKESWNPELENIEKLIKEMEEDQD